MNIWTAAGDMAFAVCLAVAAAAVVVAALAVRDVLAARNRARHDDPDATALRRARAVTTPQPTSPRRF